MKPIALSTLSAILEKRENTAIFGKNGVVFPRVGNEKGFKKSKADLPYPNYIGHITTDTNPIIFTCDGTNSAIGIYNVEEDSYEAILNDATLSYKLGFNVEGFIKGEARKNYLGELELAWIDTHNNPRFLNTANALPSELSGLDLFIKARPANFTAQMKVGGFLKQGAYYVGYKYVSEDEAESGLTTLKGPFFAVGDNNKSSAPTTKFGLTMQFDNLDTSFKKIIIIVVENIDGVTTPYQLEDMPIPTSGSLVVPYQVNNTGTAITMEEVLIEPAFYKDAKAITQENDVLYLADTEEEEELSLQLAFMNCVLKWTSELSYNDDDLVTGNTSTLKHGEVYAMYGVINWKNGQKSRAFHIPGPQSTAYYPADTIGDNAGIRGDLTLSRNWTGLTNLGNDVYMGDMQGWKNTNEYYPSKPEFGTRAGERVCHHMTPTIRWCKNNIYSEENAYGTTRLDTLGVRVTNLTFTADVQNRIASIDIFHAKRDFGRSMVMSQGYIIPFSVGIKKGSASEAGHVYSNAAVSELGNKTIWNDSPNTDLYSVISSGSNKFFTLFIDSGAANPIRWTAPYFGLVSIYSPETILDKVVFPKKTAMRVNGYVKNKYELKYNSPPTGMNIYDSENWAVISPKANSATYVVDTTTDKVELGLDSYYLGVDQTGNHYEDNAKSDTKFVVVTSGHDNYLKVPFAPPPPAVVSSELEGLKDYECVRHIDVLNTYADNLYHNYATQELVYMGTMDSNKDVKGGDTLLVWFSFNTMGIMDATKTEWVEADQKYTTKSVQWYRSFLVESPKNLAMRFQDTSNPLDRSYPSNITLNEKKKIFQHDQEINYINLPQSAKAIGNVTSIRPFNPWDENVYVNRFKIIRSNRQLREDKRNSWRYFSPLDYFETVKDKGAITNIQGYNGNLIIHHEHAVYQTASKTTLSGQEDITSIMLGSGDIFQLEPKEGKPSKTGVAGLQNVQYSAMTDFGYVFIDIKKKTIYCINEEGLSTLNGDLDNLWKEILKDVTGNPYTEGGKGVSIGYDSEHMRLLFTVKNGDNSITFSYGLVLQSWAYSHSYVPDGYISTRDKLLAMKTGTIHRFNEGDYGHYFGTEINPYFIDVVFTSGGVFILNALKWRTLVETNEDSTKFQREFLDKTFTSITIWNGNQSSGKIDITKDPTLPLDHNARSPEYNWLFNRFRNLLKKDAEFLESIFKDYKIKEGVLEDNLAWYKKDLFISDYVVVRFEYDNSENKKFTIIDLDVDINKSNR